MNATSPPRDLEPRAPGARGRSRPSDDALRGVVAERYLRVRAHTEALARPLSPEDQQVQSMPDASPTKWHLAHTTWFFERFVLRGFGMRPGPYDPGFELLFNSYYEAIGPRHPRPRRGLLSRPSLEEVLRWRAYVDDAVLAWLACGGPSPLALACIELGCNHEEQHQELILTDIGHALAQHPAWPAYDPDLPAPPAADAPRLGWFEHAGGRVGVGHAGAGFAFDNEGPRHEALLRPFRLATRPVTNGEWLAFVGDGGYRRAGLWLSDGWEAVQAGAWSAPERWRQEDGAWRELTLGGARPLDLAAPVAHVSYYEADAFATWAGKRLPSEHEWEVVAQDVAVDGNLLERGLLVPCAAPSREGGGPGQLWGDVWEWTRSPYAPYPGFRAAPGALGEYNAKFMVNQLVLRGGSCLTPEGHLRPTYRNFFPPAARWQMSGVRLAEDA